MYKCVYFICSALSSLADLNTFALTFYLGTHTNKRVAYTPFLNAFTLSKYFIKNTILKLGRIALCSQTSINSLWHGFPRMLGAFL